MMNAQEMFNTVVTHLRTQKVKAWNEERRFCLYRGPKGTRCAVGVLIPDDEYFESFERKTISSIAHLIPSLQDLLNSENTKQFNLIIRLQDTHDHYLPSEWEKELSSIAKQYD